MCACYASPVVASTLLLDSDEPLVDLLSVGGRLHLADKAFTGDTAQLSDFVSSLTPVSKLDRLGGKYWLSASVKNNTDESRWVFDPNNSIIDRIKVYVITDTDSGTQTQVLDMGHFAEHDYMLHYGKAFHLQPGQHAQLLIYFESRYFSSQPRFEIDTESAFKHKILMENTWILACIGGVIVLSIYNLFLGVWTRDSNYVFYALYLLCSMTGWSAAFNMWAQWWGAYQLELILIPFFPAITFNVLYYIHFLNLRESNHFLCRVSYLFAGLSMLMAFAFPLIQPGVYFTILSAMTSVWVVLGLGIGILRLRQGYKPALFFVAAFAVVFVAAFFLVLPNLGFKEIIPNADLGTLVAQTTDMLLLALALAHRIRIMRDERETALQQAVLAEQRASEQEKQAKNTLTEANIKLRTALEIAEEESAKKSEFLRLVSHELRTPLHSIVSSAEEWHSNGSEEDKAELIQYIAYGAARLSTQVDNLVLLAETDSDQLKAGNYIFELPPILEKLSANVSTLLAPKEVEFTTKTADLPYAFYGDGYLLEHLLRTILENACKYTDAGSVNLEIRWNQQTSQLDIELRDTGRGMTKGQLDKVFDDFLQLSRGLTRQSEGLGLGLTVCKRICQTLNAKLSLESERGVGTHALVNVPLKAITEEMARQPEHAKGRVLIVEDNPVNAKVLARMVKNCGYETDAVFSGQAAIEAIGERMYAVILMDIQMPYMDGITATAEIRKRGVTSAIIAVTANSDIEVRSKCMEQGMEGFLVKPVRKADIQRALERQLPYTL